MCVYVYNSVYIYTYIVKDRLQAIRNTMSF